MLDNYLSSLVNTKREKIMYLCVARSGEMKIMPFIPEMLEKSENYKFFKLKEVKKGENNE